MCFIGGDKNSVTNRVAKAAVNVATDKRTWKIVGVIIGTIVALVSLPLIVYMGVSGSIEEINIDTASAQQSIVQNMSAEEFTKNAKDIAVTRPVPYGCKIVK